MRVTTKSWRFYAAIYRVLVVAQTIAWAVTSLAKVISRQPRASLAVEQIGIALTIGSIVGLIGGLLTYYRHGTLSRSPEKKAIILTWVCLHIAGLFALAGYTITGEVICFIAGILALISMHVFSPNRFQNEG
ncbi:MAG TPA: hypothetical protein VK909_24540 [Anaerolineales bacterium]|nr:hypothetical protein [Anaerolineales bacterium]